MKTLRNTNSIIVALHVGRGGHFNNANYYTYLGEKNFQYLINLNSTHLFEYNRDEKGRFCKPFLTDANRNHVTDDDINGEVGRLEFDGIYETYYCDYIENLEDWKIEIIAKSGGYKSPQLVAWLEDYNSEWKFDRYGNLLEN